MKICLIKTSSMGDILHTLPALTDAQYAIPHLQIDWVVEENFAEIPHWHSAVNQIIPIAIRRWRKHLLESSTWQQWNHYRYQLQQTEYDTVVDAQGLIKSALFATYLAQGKKYGYDRHCVREPLASLFYDNVFFIDYQQHAVERIRKLMANALNYPLPSTIGDYGIAQHFLPSSTIQSNYVLFIHATTRSNKFWTIEQWRKTADFFATLNMQVHLPWGNNAEKAQAEKIAQGLSHVKVLPKMNLQQLATEIAQSKGVISVDTGLAHLTAALAKPNITLYGATDPKLIGTYGINQYHIQRATMEQIQAQDVISLIQQIRLFES
ncbi:MAG: lipopolysaccharide heptosyltransferase RfaC [Pasteurellaceae bacterium]|nr:lipopolysaccharide heptosyltransferase RfaC [Pasteurellaceae bacterium]